MPVPTQIMGLLPPAPEEGWPCDFALDRIVERLRERQETGDADVPYAPASDAYPARRRATRLSYAIWAVVGGSSQPLLETTSTADRLRYALHRLELVRAQILAP